jgi:hypothetical protein
VDSDFRREYICYYFETTNSLFWELSSDGSDANETGLEATSFGAPSLATWYFVYADYDAAGNLMRICVNDGTKDSIAHTGGAGGDQNANFILGDMAAGGTALDGSLDQVGFWTRKLTNAEVAWLYNSGNGRAYSELG